MAIHPLETRSGVLCTGLPELEPALKRWVEIQSAFDEANEEGPFSYTERPQVGFLAAAIWGSGGIALEEWKTEKVGGGTGRAVSDYSGRCDLWFTTNLMPPGDRGGWYLEAKHVWMNARGLAERLPSSERNGIEQAVAAAKRHRNQRNRVACVFISVVVERQRAGEPDQYPRLLGTLPKIAAEADAQAVAWYITPQDRLDSQWLRESADTDLAVATILLLASCGSED